MKQVFIIGLLCLVLIGCNWWVHTPEPVYFVAEYTVSGSATRANITFSSATILNQVLPWIYINEQALSGDDFYLAAQSNDAAGDLTVALTIDGAPFMSETTAAPFGFVAIYGAIP